ncbi:hypothetical protein DEJ15_03370 [Curtobacterium sp. MCJR17_043]|nr:hypothetical protein [Curtobacterium sp. MCJR17_043]WIB36244.1 hypothetical protein DEJ15_03370 [Curtobacterium sp. MCJR17_043]
MHSHGGMLGTFTLIALTLAGAVYVVGAAGQRRRGQPAWPIPPDGRLDRRARGRGRGARRTTRARREPRPHHARPRPRRHRHGRARAARARVPP